MTTMPQAQCDYLVRTIQYFEGCIAAYDTLKSRSEREGFDLPEVFVKTREDCARWRDDLEAMLTA